MAPLKIDISGINGLASSYSSITANLNYFAGDGETTQGSYNPFAFPGYMAPPRSINKTLTESTQTKLNITAYYDPTLGKFLTGGTNGSGQPCINVYADLDDTSANSAQSYTATGYIYDFEAYQLNGSRKIFFTSYQGGSGYIGVTDGTNFEDRWCNGDAAAALYTGTVTNPGTFSYPPFLRVASNGFMYAFTANLVHKIDGTSAGGTAGTITASALTLEAKYKISDAVDWRNLMYIAISDTNDNPFGDIDSNTNKLNNQCGIFIWDRVSTQLGQRDFIPLYGVKFIKRIYVAHDGKLRLLCVTSNEKTQLREYNGVYFETIFEFPKAAVPLWHDALTISGYATFWLGQDNYIYAHGKPLPGLRNGIYKLGTPSSNAITAGDYGFLYYANNGSEANAEALFVSYKLTADTYSTNKKILFNHNSTPTGYSSSLPGSADTTIPKTGLIQLPFMSNTEDVVIYFAPVTSSGAGDETDVVGNIKVYLNGSTTAFKSKNVTKKDTRKGYIKIPLNEQYVNSIQFGVDWTSVTSVGNISGLTNDCMPQYALLNYKSTSTYR